MKMNIGGAIEAAKKGKKIRRAGWNGKGMYVVYQKGYPDGIPCNANTAEACHIEEGTLFKIQPYLIIKQPNGVFSMWAPSGNDALAEDWEASLVNKY